MAHRKHTRLVVESSSPIPNGLTTVAEEEIVGMAEYEVRYLKLTWGED